MARLIDTKDIPLRDIDVSRRLRPVNETAVVSLMASLMEIGQKDEIHVRRVRHQSNRLVRGNQHTGGRQNDIMSFCQSTAEQRALSTRQIERLVAAGSALDEEAIALLRKAPVRVTLSDLQTLGKCGDAAHRRSICEILSRGEAKNAKAALEGLKAHPGAALVSPIEAETRKIMAAWSRASKAARRRFVEDYRDELDALLKQGVRDEG